MKQTYNTIDYAWLTRPTGDPFADDNKEQSRITKISNQK